MTTTEDELDKIIQDIEVNSAIALHKSLEDGDPAHHEEFVSKSKVVIMSLLNTELYKAREDELNQIPHELLHIPEVHEYKSKRLASLKENI